MIDVDPRNGGDVGKVREVLASLGVRIFAEVDTPGRGMHFYVAGRADIATAHLSSVAGWPGVDVQSAGTNVYLVGTMRAKYDGAGYVVRVNDLAALADGGDPDGADLLAGWLVDHRSARPEAHATAPTWQGGEHDARQRAYLTATVARAAAELAAMAPDSGRNDALSIAAMKLGNLVTGAGLDEAVVVAALTSSSITNGLLGEDGASSVAATIASGLRYGKARPRAIPPAPPVGGLGGKLGRAVNGPETAVGAGPTAPETAVGAAGGAAGLRKHWRLADRYATEHRGSTVHTSSRNAATRSLATA